MKKKSTINTYIGDNIPCTATLTKFERVKADGSADNPWDFNGYYEVEFELDSAEAEREASEQDIERITNMFIERSSDENI